MFFCLRIFKTPCLPLRTFCKWPTLYKNMYHICFSVCHRFNRLAAALLCGVLVLILSAGPLFAEQTGDAVQIPPAAPPLPPVVEVAPTEPPAEEPLVVQEPTATLIPLAAGVNPWEEPEQGFEIARFPAVTSAGREMDIMVARIDPAFFDFVILAATMPGEQPRTLQDWAAKHNLSAAVNAGMFLPDSLTHTGYLRVKAHQNNGRLVTRFGAFFVTDPKEPGLPSGMVLDRTVPEQEALVSKYNSVVQNYRMISSSRKLLWRVAPQVHAVAAVGTDGNGRILFIHCREPIAGVDFGAMLLALPLDVRQVMYVEGGTQAGLYVRPGGTQLRMGRHPADFWTDGGVKMPLPNIIGAKPKGR